uniref:peptidylprolyl isomerase n=1 Tax=Phaeocystis antarctica TaxID=33657 RepID=A0A7S0EZR4_9EUKA|mmetsp:Transcript_33580/g.79242  ORF Transcript_33580/g.79242 Transcript_33580/m.79242 type:complete len:244 (+) Transcript_33580:79-810(+)
MLAVLALSPSALLVQPPRLPRVVAERLTTATAAAAAFGTCEAAQALPSFDEVMVELNKPPITLNPFSLQPAGAAFFAGYGVYLAWNVFRPPNAAEVEAQERRDVASVAASAASAPFLRAAAEAPGARKTESGLIYEELAAGEGASPALEQMVKVHYVGTLADGTVFDSSRDRGEPTEFVLNQVIKGWQEGLALMKPGSRAKLTIPAELAYGPMATGGIPANSALCFDVELIEVKEAGGFKFPF